MVLVLYDTILEKNKSVFQYKVVKLFLIPWFLQDRVSMAITNCDICLEQNYEYNIVKNWQEQIKKVVERKYVAYRQMQHFKGGERENIQMLCHGEDNFLIKISLFFLLNFAS